MVPHGRHRLAGRHRGTSSRGPKESGHLRRGPQVLSGGGRGLHQSVPGNQRVAGVRSSSPAPWRSALRRGGPSLRAMGPERAADSLRSPAVSLQGAARVHAGDRSAPDTGRQDLATSARSRRMPLMSERALRVAILGGGPAGSALAILLCRQGAEVTLFDDGRRPELLVGESLVPAVIPILGRLGVEPETASVGLVKPGVSLIWSPRDRFTFSFARFSPAVPPYAYNIPRPQFDEVLLSKAVGAGAHRVVARARLERCAERSEGAELAMTADTIAAAPSLRGRQPDLIVDATGRARRAGRTLDIPVHVGPRDDIAHFAHFEGFEWSELPGLVVISRLETGWSWQIPLRDRLSVGIVLRREDAARLGGTPAERLDRAIARTPQLTQSIGGAKRVTSVATYTNYQLISARAHGPGWVTVGDAFGFIDPMLSPGVFLALRSAEMVADALRPFSERPDITRPAELSSALRPYVSDHRRALTAWMELVDSLYDGRMLALMRAGHDWMRERSGALTSVLQGHIERRLALQATGVGTNSRYSRLLLRFLGRHGLRGLERADFAIR
ncbi:MAG: hypothetical protein C5B48_10200 [Candidatus Rokuibacteriota bacterium]|nr:MAG: hypothetical protein C5B48_10200 [Candidatus Rokubacteria bacterium]